ARQAPPRTPAWCRGPAGAEPGPRRLQERPVRRVLPGGAAQRPRQPAVPTHPATRRNPAARPSTRNGALMALRRRDSELKHPGVSHLEYKRVEMDRVLTGFLMRVNHNGLPSKMVQRKELSVGAFVKEFTKEQHAAKFPGFAEHSD